MDSSTSDYTYDTPDIPTEVTPAEAVNLIPQVLSAMIQSMRETECTGHQLAIGLNGLMTLKELEDVIVPPTTFQQGLRSLGLAIVALGGRLVAKS